MGRAPRRVAAMVAAGEFSLEELFGAVTAEAGALSGADLAVMAQHDPDSTVTRLATWAAAGEPPALPDRWPADEGDVLDRLSTTLAPVWVDNWSAETGEVGTLMQQLGARSSVSVPIVLDGRLWGSLTVFAKRGKLTPDTETRLENFAQLLATAMSNLRARAQIQRLAEAQAALRRVATLVARQADQGEVFATVVEEVATLLGVNDTRMMRYEHDGTATVLTGWPEYEGAANPYGRVVPIDGDSVTRRVLETGRPARIDDFEGLQGAVATLVHARGMRSAAGAPIIVGGRPWGVLLAMAPEPGALSVDIEHRIEEFCVLVATAISNVEARAQIRRLADGQAALRRVATLVAGEASLDEVFETVTEEVCRTLDFDATHLTRYGLGDSAVHVFSWPDDELPRGASLTLAGDSVTARIRRSRRPARIDDYSTAEGPLADVVLAQDAKAAVGVPIIVDGVLWGTLVSVRNGTERPPLDSEERIAEFGALVATAISNDDARAEVRRLADEQAALRRVATSVARQSPADEIFLNVVEEAARVLAFDHVRLLRFLDDDRSTEVISSWPPGYAAPEPGWSLDDGRVTTRVKNTALPARIESVVDGDGTIAEGARAGGLTAAAPIIVSGHLWGELLGVRSGTAPAVPGIESRIEEFTTLVATAVANLEARAQVARLVDEQGTLRRVATLVAHQPSAEQVFSTVVLEMGQLLRVDDVRLIRFDAGGTATLVSGWPTVGDIPAGTNPLEGDTITSRILRTRAPARFDDYARATGSFATYVHDTGTRTAAGAPIIVDGKLWGALVATAREPVSLPPDIESRIEEFTALIATAISNVEARAALAASRQRIVVATDEARRRFERDLHDGAQQRLVSLALDLRLTQAEAQPEIAARIGQSVDVVSDVLEGLRELSSGLHPAVLSEGGLRPALRALARRSAIPVRLRVEGAQRVETRVEVATYYLVSEALANAAKHSGASVIDVSVTRENARLHVVIRDDGAGGANPATGSGLIGLTDRVEALGGTITVASPAGKGTSIEVALPLDTASE